MAKNGLVIRAIDDGYGDIKAYNGRVTGEVKKEEKLNSWDYFKRTGCLLMPSHVILDIGTKGSSGFDLGELDPLSYVKVEYEGRKYIVGLGAVEEDRNAKWEGTENKHKNIFFPVLMATTLGLLAETEKEMVDTLIMGLPVKAEKDPARHELLRKLILNKTHKVKIELANGMILDRSVVVNDLIIHRQPFGSLNYLMLNDSGEFRNRQIAQEYNTIGDIGTKTFNIYTLDKLKNVESLSDNTNDGMMEAYKRINEDILRETGDKIPEGKLSEIIKEGTINSFDFTHFRSFHYEYQAQIVCGVLEDTLGSNASQVDNIIWTGGGSEEDVLGIYLLDKMDPNLAKKKIYFLGRFSTAIGLYRFALYVALRSKQNNNSNPNNSNSSNNVSSNNSGNANNNNNNNNNNKNHVAATSQKA